MDVCTAVSQCHQLTIPRSEDNGAFRCNLVIRRN